jgi:hypothetical protein
VAQWSGSIVLRLVHVEQTTMTELHNGCPDVDMVRLVTEAYATCWSPCSEESDLEVKAGFEYVILVMMSSCCD